MPSRSTRHRARCRWSIWRRCASGCSLWLDRRCACLAPAARHAGDRYRRARAGGDLADPWPADADRRRTACCSSRCRRRRDAGSAAGDRAGANAQEPAYQTLIAAAPALKPLVKAASWIGDRRWDLLFASGETLQLPEGERRRRGAGEVRRARRRAPLLGRGYLRFDLRDPARLVVRMPGGACQVAIRSGDA